MILGVLLSLAVIFLVKTVVVALGAIYVRAQMAVHQGFDLGLAAIALGAGELVVGMLEPADGWKSWAIAGAAVALLGASVGAVWSWVLARRISPAGDGAGVLVASLGLATLASGLVLTIRGPGLAQLPEYGGPAVAGFSTSMQAALVIAALGALSIMAWYRSRVGLQALLLDQDRAFAEELGCRPADAAIGTGLCCGLGAAAAGAANAFLSGTTPGAGLALFLQAAAAALLFQRVGFAGALGGAAVIAGLYVSAAVALPLNWADFVVFGFVLAILVFRGRDRSAELVR